MRKIDKIYGEFLSYFEEGLHDWLSSFHAESPSLFEAMKYSMEAGGKRIRPVLLLAANATVTVCHSRTNRLEEFTRGADIVVAALGRARALDEDYFEPGQIVIDVGINDAGDGTLVGDVDFDSVEPLVDAITPVPAGVGSVTTSVLCAHVIEAAERR